MLRIEEPRALTQAWLVVCCACLVLQAVLRTARGEDTSKSGRGIARAEEDSSGGLTVRLGLALIEGNSPDTCTSMCSHAGRSATIPLARWPGGHVKGENRDAAEDDSSRG
jgi:hypothetical protein